MKRSNSFSRFRVPPPRARRSLSMIHLDSTPVTQRNDAINQQSSLAEATDVLQETFHVTSFLTRLTGKLVYFASRSWQAWVMFARLVAFALILLPGFLKLVYRYIASDIIFREFYGTKRRQSLGKQSVQKRFYLVSV